MIIRSKCRAVTTPFMVVGRSCSHAMQTVQQGERSFDAIACNATGASSYVSKTCLHFTS